MRPGGAYIQPDDWYRLYAAVNQARATPSSHAPASELHFALAAGKVYERTLF